MTVQTILLVEDNEDDVFVMRRALRIAGIEHPLHIVTHGQQALDYLTGAGDYADRSRHPLPAIIFLDLKLPVVDGFDVLTKIRQQATLAVVMVVVLTASAENRDKDHGVALGVKSYLIKPPSPGALKEIFNSLATWRLALGNAAAQANPNGPLPPAA